MQRLAPLFVSCLFGAALAAEVSSAQGPNQRPAPDAAAQQRMLDAIHEYASQYVSNLPNFLCQQVTYQFEGGRKAKHWHQGDTLTSRLIFNQGREVRTLEMVNDKPIQRGMRYWRTPLISEGEFGMLIETVFEESSAATFTWSHWDGVNDQPVAVFDYAIDRRHSTLSLGLSDLAKAIVAYHGSVYADPESGVIRRITNAAEDIPPEIQTRSIGTIIDYADIDIAGQKYLLPSEAIVSLATESNHIRNEIHFQSYRKFEADSHITFASPGDAQGTKGPPEN